MVRVILNRGRNGGRSIRSGEGLSVDVAATVKRLPQWRPLHKERRRATRKGTRWTGGMQRNSSSGVFVQKTAEVISCQRTDWPCWCWDSSADQNDRGHWSTRNWPTGIARNETRSIEPKFPSSKNLKTGMTHNMTGPLEGSSGIGPRKLKQDLPRSCGSPQSINATLSNS